MDVIGYIRVSTAEQADSGLGLMAQRVAIEKACEARVWHLRALYEDAGASGKTMKRPGLASALKELEDGTAAGLVVAKLDRLSRSLLDFTGLMEQSSKKGWALVALDLGVDTSTPSGELMANTVASFAQFERKLIGQRTKDALAIKKAEGVRLGRPTSVPDEVVEEIVRRRAEGQTLRAIAEHLNETGVPCGQGGKQWYPTTVSNLAQRVLPTG